MHIYVTKMKEFFIHTKKIKANDGSQRNSPFY